MNSIAPVWDGNETWLVLGGGGLLAAFPLAYAIVLPALYAPLIAMLLGLVFRGVAFEYRWRDPGHRKYLGRRASSSARWSRPSRRGSRSARCCRGSRSTGRAYAGGWWDWLTPFSLLTGASLVVGYALLGAAWLIWKTEGDAAGPGAAIRAPGCCPPCSPRSARSASRRRSSRRNIIERWFDWPGLLRHRADAAARSAASRLLALARASGAAATGCPSPRRSACSR